MKLSTGERVSARSVVIASGARYRRPAVTGLETFEGSSVHYWASPLEAKLCAGQEIALVGAGNSAGQAAVYLASRLRRCGFSCAGGISVRACPDIWLTVSRGSRTWRSRRKHTSPRLKAAMECWTRFAGVEEHRARGPAIGPTSISVYRRGAEYRLAVWIGRRARSQRVRTNWRRAPRAVNRWKQAAGGIRHRGYSVRIGEARRRSRRRGRAGRGSASWFSIHSRPAGADQHIFFESRLIQAGVVRLHHFTAGRERTVRRPAPARRRSGHQRDQPLSPAPWPPLLSASALAI